MTEGVWFEPVGGTPDSPGREYRAPDPEEVARFADDFMARVRRMPGVPARAGSYGSLHLFTDPNQVVIDVLAAGGYGENPDPDAELVFDDAHFYLSEAVINEVDARLRAYAGVDPDVHDYADYVIAAIRRDQQHGVLPKVTRFVDVHDYVDGNQYVLDARVPVGTDPGAGPEGVETANAVCEEVDRMLGMVHAFRCPCCGDDVFSARPVCDDCDEAGCTPTDHAEGWDWRNCQRTGTDPDD